MRASFLIVVACIDLGGSYYDQTSLSSVLSAFEARLTIPRSKETEQSANESGLCPTTLTASAPISTAVPTSAAATKMPAEVSTVSTASAATRGSTEVAAEEDTSAAAEEDTSAAATKMPAEVSTVSTESAATRGSTEVTATSNPTFMNDYIEEENLTNKEGLLQEHEVSQIKDTVPNAALPSHLATNSGTSHTVGSVHTWTYKEVSLVAHVGQVLWLAVLTGMAFHFLGATAHL